MSRQALPLRLGAVGHAVEVVAMCPPDRLTAFSVGLLVALVLKSGLPLQHVREGARSMGGMNPFFMAFTAFAVQLAVVSGIVLSLGVLRRSGSTRRGKSAPMMRLIYDCGTTWIHICSVCCVSYLLIGLDVLPAVVIGERPIHLVRIAEWVYTVPLVWYVYARVYTSATEWQLSQIVTVNIMMLTVGYSGIFSLSHHTLLYVPVFTLAMVLFCYQAELLWKLAATGSGPVSSMARRVYLIGQFLMAVYPAVWICGDLRLIPAILEQAYVYTFLDVLCKLVLVWSCIVLRFIQAFPVLHACFEGSQQFLDASHDVRLTVDADFRVCDVDGKEALLHHYLSAGVLLSRCILDICHGDAERRKLLRVAQTVDRQGADMISPKIKLALSRGPDAPGGKDVVSVCTECVVSAAQNGGLRLLGITFHELEVTEAEAAEGPSRWQVSQNSSANSPPEGEPRQVTPSVLEMDSASCVEASASHAMSRRAAQQAWRRNSSSREVGEGASLVERRSALRDNVKDNLCDQKSHVSMLSGVSRRSEASMISASSIREHVEWVHHTIGQLLETEEEPAFLADMMSESYPIVGCSRGFLELTQYTQEGILGTSIFFLEEGIPDELISKSSRKNMTSFCQACHLSAGVGGRQVGDLQVMQPSRRACGSVFVNCCLCTLVMLRNRPYLLGVPTALAEGSFAKLSKAALEAHKEDNREKARRLRQNLQAKINDRRLPEVDEEGSASFFSEQLQDHCILMGHGRTALRREPYDLPNGCLVYSHQPIFQCEDGTLRFSVLVDDVTPKFDGLPLLGFTQREPRDSIECYPSQAHALAQSVSIGRNGEAFARDQHSHAVIGFKAPLPEELATWCLDADRPAHLRRAPCRPEPGDMLECVWGPDGRLAMLRNGEEALSFDVGRCPERCRQYYAFVDVCLSVSQVTLMPFKMQPASPLPSEGHFAGDRGSMEILPDCHKNNGDLSPLELKIRSSVLDMLARQAITEAVADCPFCVTVADPGEDDCPLVAVSNEFLRITGYSKAQVLGRNCRFLNEGCPADPSDIMALRRASTTGERVTLLLTNRRRTGELFINLLDLAGVSVAQDLDSGEDIWYLIGVQADCTHLAEGQLPKDHLSELVCVAGAIRVGLERELRQMALDSVQEGMTDQSYSSGMEHMECSSMTHSAETTREGNTDYSESTHLEGADSNVPGADTAKRGAYRRRIKVLEDLQWCGGAVREAPGPKRPATPPECVAEGEEEPKGCVAHNAPPLWLFSSLLATSAAAAAVMRIARRG